MIKLQTFQTISQKICEANMGGYGSGRQGWKTKASNYRSIDVNRFHKSGYLSDGTLGSWQWARDGEKVASISYRAEAARLVLIYPIHALFEDLAAPNG